MKIKKTIIYDRRRNPVAALLDWSTFQMLEEALEDRAIARKIKEVKHEKPLTRAQALRRYAKLKRA